MKHKLHDFQNEACRAMWKANFKENKTNGLLILPTGSGKTFTAMSYVDAIIKAGLVNNVLWIAHRIELIKQAAECATLINPDMTQGLWTAKKKESGAQITFAMIQSTRTLAKSRKQYDYLIVDECHHCSAFNNDYVNMYQKLIRGTSHKYLLGLTATASRLDGKKLGFKDVFYQKTFLDLVKDGFLARPIYYEMLTKDFYRLDHRNGTDFTGTALKKLNNPARNEKIVKEYLGRRQIYGQTLIFAVNVSHCSDLNNCFNTYAPDVRVRVVTGTTPNEERNTLRSDMDEGKVDVVINCQVFTEGWDAPSIETVMIARPTMSETLYMQQVGRGARIKRDKDGKVIKDTFNLVSIMDDITKYSTLVKEWLPNLMKVEETEEDRRAKRVISATKEYEKACKKAGVLPKLGDANIVEVEGVLQFSTRFKCNTGLPIDQDRGDCMRKLALYAKECWNKDTFDLTKFTTSYTSCVLNGELPRKMWKDMCYAWWSNFIRKQHTVTDYKTNILHKTWDFIPIIEFTKGMEGAAKLRIQADNLAAKKLNGEFNALYGSPTAGKNLLNKLKLDILKEATTKTKYTINQVMNAMLTCTSKDRNIIVKTSLTINGDKDPIIRWVYKVGELLTSALQERLDDSCAQVIVKTSGRR